MDASGIGGTLRTVDEVEQGHEMPAAAPPDRSAVEHIVRPPFGVIISVEQSTQKQGKQKTQSKVNRRYRKR